MMMSVMQQEALMPEKVTRNDEDEMSTVSGGSEGGIVSLPASPAKVWPETPIDSTVVPPATLADLPSLGSLGHFAGQCSRCCFHPKGRCQNGYDCRFCHYDHDKRRRKKKVIVRGVPVYHELQDKQQAYGHQTTAQVHQQLGLEPALGFTAPLSQIHAAPQHALNSRVEPYQASEPHHVEPPTQNALASSPVECWPVEKVVNWLVSVDLGHISQNFQDHRITGDILLELTVGELEEIGVHAVGDKKRFLRVVSQLRGLPPAPPPPVLPPPAMQTLQPSNWCQHAPCWEATAAPPPPYYGSNNTWSSHPNVIGQQPFGAPMPNFMA
jgi:hypothetical protein